MTKDEVPMAMAGPDGAPEYRNLIRQLRGERIGLARAQEERRSVSIIRRSYANLDRTLGRAVTYAARQVRAPYLTSHAPAPPPLDNDVAAAWHSELRRLRDLRERLRFVAMGDPLGSVPHTVQVATRAATGPRLPGLRVEEHRAVLPAGTGMGIDLPAVLDRVSSVDRAGAPADPLISGARVAAAGSPPGMRAAGTAYTRPEYLRVATAADGRPYDGHHQTRRAN